MTRYALSTAPGVASALSVVSLEAGSEQELDDSINSITGRKAGSVGSVDLRDLAGVDRGLVLRWSESCADLTPHGGPAVIRALTEKLESLGLQRSESTHRPEARTDAESRWLDLIARCPSPRGLELLLAQPALHDEWPEVVFRAPDDADRLLHRLIEPPLVAVIGATNIGKSTLLNALARRTVAVAADEPGVTRDAVGALVEIDGLVVRWLDTPGVMGGATGPDAQAAALAQKLVAGADLVLSTCDAGVGPVEFSGDAVVVGLRSDLGPPACETRLSVSARDDASVAAFAGAVRRLLVPDALLESGRPWRLWEEHEHGAQGSGGA